MESKLSKLTHCVSFYALSLLVTAAVFVIKYELTIYFLLDGGNPGANMREN